MLSISLHFVLFSVVEIASSAFCLQKRRCESYSCASFSSQFPEGVVEPVIPSAMPLGMVSCITSTQELPYLSSVASMFTIVISRHIPLFLGCARMYVWQWRIGQATLLLSLEIPEVDASEHGSPFLFTSFTTAFFYVSPGLQLFLQFQLICFVCFWTMKYNSSYVPILVLILMHVFMCVQFTYIKNIKYDYISYRQTCMYMQSAQLQSLLPFLSALKYLKITIIFSLILSSFV